MKKHLLCFLLLFVFWFLQAKENKDQALKFSIKGQKYLDTKKYKKALAFFTKAIEIDSTQACYWAGYAKAFYHSYKSEGNYVGNYSERAKRYYEKVISYYQKVIKLGNDSIHCVVDAYIGLAELEYHDLSHYLTAMDYYKSAICLDPTNPTIYKDRADLQDHLVTKSTEFGCVISPLVINYRNDSLKTDKLSYNDIAKNAIKDYMRSIELKHPDSAFIYSKCGNIYLYYLKEYEESVKYYTKSIDINPSYGFPYIFRAEAKHRLLDDIGACEDYKQSFKLFNMPMSDAEKKKYCK